MRTQNTGSGDQARGDVSCWPGRGAGHCQHKVCLFLWNRFLKFHKPERYKPIAILIIKETFPIQKKVFQERA